MVSSSRTPVLDRDCAYAVYPRRAPDISRPTGQDPTRLGI